MKFTKKNVMSVQTPLDNLFAGIRTITQTSTPSITNNLAKSALSLESADDSSISRLQDLANDIGLSLESIYRESGFDGSITEAQKDAAVLAGIYTGDVRGFLLAKPKEVASISTESSSYVGMIGGDSFESRTFGIEAYDERDNRNATLFSIAYNMQAARQDEFGEAFTPTITVPSTDFGIAIEVSVMTVFDGAEHKTSGSLEGFAKKNIIRAVADHTILKKDQTRIMPVVRVASADKFVNPADVAVSNIVFEGENVSTAPLAIGKKVSLLAVSQLDSLITLGLMDQTDSLDTNIEIQNIYVKFGTGGTADVVKINVANLPLFNFVANPQANYRQSILNANTTSILLNKDTRQVDGGAMQTLTELAANDVIVRLEVNLSGTVNIETSETVVYANAVSTHIVRDNTGLELDQTVAPTSTLVGKINGGTIIGYDILAYRSNSNRRQRGQFIDTTKFRQMYGLNLRSPITAIHPMNSDGTVEASDIQTLITTTAIRLKNESVTTVLTAAATLKQYVDARDVVGVGPDVLGVGRFFVKPTYYEENIDMVASINSLTSEDRPGNIQAVLVNKIRDYAYRMYRDSEYKPAADALQGGISKPPVVIVGTDPVLARYINVTGDLRTLSGEFDVKIVASYDQRMQGKVVITFGDFSENRNTTVNPLNFGNMIWSPEIVLAGNISRGNTSSRELIVQPRYRFFVNLPVMTVLTVTNVPDVLNKTSIDFNQI